MLIVTSDGRIRTDDFLFVPLDLAIEKFPDSVRTAREETGIDLIEFSKDKCIYIRVDIKNKKMHYVRVPEDWLALPEELFLSGVDEVFLT